MRMPKVLSISCAQIIELFLCEDEIMMENA
jgi:hypothetical protein